MPKNEAFKIARQIYAQFSDSDQDFTASEVKLALRAALEGEKQAAFNALVDSAFKAAEQSEKDKANSNQLTLFDVGGTLVLGDDRRRGLKYAQRSHFEESLNIKRANAEAVLNKLRTDEEKFEKLKPYWPEGRAYIEAVEKYLADNPDSKTA